MGLGEISGGEGERVKTIVGVDEAGYGPTLGPLVLGMAALRFREPPPADLWRHLRSWVSRSTAADGARLRVDDSKKLLGARRSLGALELTALSVLGDPSDPAPAQQLEQLCPLNSLEGAPWYREWPAQPELPVAVESDLIADWRRKLDRERAENGLLELHCRVDPILEPRFNDSLARTRNKATTHVGFVRECMRTALETYPEDDMLLCVDRLGGRRYYEGLLGDLAPMEPMAVLCEQADRSHYRIRQNGRSVEVRFETKSDSRHLPVALASICAKYVRELFVRRLNAWFATRRPGLRPTAGYPEDARRFLAEVDDLLSPELRAQLVRQR